MSDGMGRVIFHEAPPRRSRASTGAFDVGDPSNKVTRDGDPLCRFIDKKNGSFTVKYCLMHETFACWEHRHEIELELGEPDVPAWNV